MKRIVIALGGNALGNTPSEQIASARKTAKALAPLIIAGNEVIITHGNGPQVGMINSAFASASMINPAVSAMPFPECGAMSQGYIGYHLQNALQNELASRGADKAVTTIITQVEVDPDDPAFQNPTKPIGAFYSEQEAQKIAAEKGYVMKEDAGRGYRRVVASPKPVNVLEVKTVQTLVQAGQTVITVGGGGIPVIRRNGVYEGVAAVIDKDYASACLAKLLDADLLIILTAVARISLNYGKENQVDLEELRLEEARKYLEEGHFLKGSMGPKVEAALSFVEEKPGRSCIIAALENAALSLEGKTGTKIYH
jgi:carbamate kinase